MTLLTVSYDLCPLKANTVLSLRFLKVLKVLVFKEVLKENNNKTMLFS